MQQLIDREIGRGVPSRRIVLMGFSQGCAMTLMTGLRSPQRLAGLAGLWSERAGVVNIGLEGMMILGTLGAGYYGYNYGVWAGLGLGSTDRDGVFSRSTSGGRSTPSSWPAGP